MSSNKIAGRNFTIGGVVSNDRTHCPAIPTNRYALRRGYRLPGMTRCMDWCGLFRGLVVDPMRRFSERRHSEGACHSVYFQLPEARKALSSMPANQDRPDEAEFCIDKKRCTISLFIRSLLAE